MAPRSGSNRGNKPPIGKRFQPGQTGNPHGRPKSKLSSLLAEYGREKAPGDQITRESKLALAIWNAALQGDASCREILLDRLAPPESNPFGQPGAPVVFTLNLGDAGKSQ